MPIPLIPIAVAVSAGGTLVPHAAGGMIVSTAGGYVTGTYLSTTAIASIFAASTSAIGVGAVTYTGIIAKIVGSAGIFGTTIGATGLTGYLMRAGIMKTTPILLPVAISGGVIGLIILFIGLFKLNWKLKKAKEGNEVDFKSLDAKIIEALVKLLSQKEAEA